MTPAAVDVFGLGQCCLDYIGLIDAYPAPDAKCEVGRMDVQGGGPVATALVALARWNLTCALAGVVGDDAFGDEIRASLKAEGIDTRGLLVRPSAASQFAFIVAEAGSGRRTIFWRRPTGPAPKPAEIDMALLRRAKVLHTDGLFVEAALAACREARAAGVQVVVDAGTLRDGMLAVARQSDVFIASETFARALVGADRPAEACRKLAELGPRVVGVTLGARGYVTRAAGRTIAKPAYAVTAVDTTGCGDVFHAGFIYGLIRNWPLESSFDFAAWAAARVCLQPGGRRGIPEIEDWTPPDVGVQALFREEKDQ